MTTLLSAALTTAQTAVVSTPLEFRDGNPESAIIQGSFTYGSGGTSASVWVQTSADQGLTWIDVANFSFTTASARFAYNLSALTPVTAEYTPTDGALAANTAKDGLLGNLWRAKLTTTGTYVATSLRVDVQARGRLTQ
jgi:hypothetical protein